MDAELYFKKALLQASKGDFEKATASMKSVIKMEDDIVAVTQAHCFLGEYYFVKQDYKLAKEHLEWIEDNGEKLESEYDDLLNDEIYTADVLLEMIKKFSLV